MDCALLCVALCDIRKRTGRLVQGLLSGMCDERLDRPRNGPARQRSLISTQSLSFHFISSSSSSGSFPLRVQQTSQQCAPRCSPLSLGLVPPSQGLHPSSPVLLQVHTARRLSSPSQSVMSASSSLLKTSLKFNAV